MILMFLINRPHIYFFPHVFVIIFQCACVNFVDLWPRKAASSSSFNDQESLEVTTIGTCDSWCDRCFYTHAKFNFT